MRTSDELCIFSPLIILLPLTRHKSPCPLSHKFGVLRQARHTSAARRPLHRSSARFFTFSHCWPPSIDSLTCSATRTCLQVQGSLYAASRWLVLWRVAL